MLYLDAGQCQPAASERPRSGLVALEVAAIAGHSGRVNDGEFAMQGSQNSNIGLPKTAFNALLAWDSQLYYCNTCQCPDDTL